MYGNSLYGQVAFGEVSSSVTIPEENYIDLIQYLPPIYSGVKEMEELQDILGYQSGEALYYSNDILNQCFISTATWGLNRWEKVFGLTTDKSKSYDRRREILLAKLRGTGTVTKEMIKNVAIAFSGGEVVIQEYTDEYRFVIQFIGVKGIPLNMAGLINAVDEIKPAHLSYSFKYTYTTWDQLNKLTWNNAKQKTWSDLRIYEGE